MDRTIVSSSGRDVITHLESPKSAPCIEELGYRPASEGSFASPPVTPTDIGLSPRTDARTDVSDKGSIFSYELGNPSRTKRYSSTDRRSPKHSKHSSRRQRSDEEVRRARSRGISGRCSPKRSKSQSKYIEDTDDQPLYGTDDDLGRISEPFLENINDDDWSATVASDTTSDYTDRNLKHYVGEAGIRRGGIGTFNGHIGEAVRTFKTFNTEAMKVKVARRERGISAAILCEDKAEITERVKALIESITELEGRKDITFDEFKEELEQIEFNAEEAKVENEVSEEELAEVRRLNFLKVIVMMKGLKVNGADTKRCLDGSLLPGDFMVDLTPPPTLWIGTSRKDITPDIDDEGKMSDRVFLNPHEVIKSKAKAISTMHWLRCCKTRFTKPTGIPGPEYFLPHGAIRYSERYTVNINKPAHMELNATYTREDWLPWKTDLQKRPYISDLVKHRIISREEQAVSRLHWVRCCRFRFMTEADIAIGLAEKKTVTPKKPYRVRFFDECDWERRFPNENHLKRRMNQSNDETDYLRHGQIKSILKSVASREKSSSGKKSKKTVKSKIYTGLCPSTRQLPMKTTGSNMEPSHLIPHIRIFDQSGNATLENRHRNTNIKNAKSRIDTGLGSNLKAFSSLSPILECDETENDTMETRHRRFNIKNAKSKIDSGLLVNSKRLPPISQGTESAWQAISPRSTSDGRSSLSPHPVLPPITTSKATTRNVAAVSNAVQNVTNVTKRALPPLSGKNKQPPNGKIKQRTHGTIKPESNGMAVLPAPCGKNTKPPNSRKVQKSRGQGTTGQAKKAGTNMEARNGHLPPLKKYPTSPVRIEASLSARSSQSPLPAIGKNDAGAKDDLQCGHFGIRFNSSRSDFWCNLMKNDYY